jgi:hypothetical protein
MQPIFVGLGTLWHLVAPLVREHLRFWRRYAGAMGARNLEGMTPQEREGLFLKLLF